MSHTSNQNPQQPPSWPDLLSLITSFYVERATTDEIREIRSAISFYVQNPVSVATDPSNPSSSNEQEEVL